MFLAPPAATEIRAEAMVQDVYAAAREEEPASTSSSATESRKLLRITAGRAVYPLVKPVSLIQTWSGRGWVCWATELGFLYKGEGQTVSEAERDWAERVHADVQKLYSMRPHEMDASETERWRSLLGVIDIAYYRDETPLALREIGSVRWGKLSYPSRVYWIDGRRDRLPLDSVPPELAKCRPGQWIEAIVRRHPRTRRLLSIEHVQLIESVHMPTEAALTKQWEAMKRADVSEEEWDWPTEGTAQPDVGTASDK